MKSLITLIFVVLFAVSLDAATFMLTTASSINLDNTNGVMTVYDQSPKATVSVSASVGVTNTPTVAILNDYNPDVNATNLLSATITNSWPLLVTNVTIANYTGDDLAAGDSLVTAGIEIANVSRLANRSALLLCANYVSHTNLTSLLSVDMVIAYRPITTWAAASSALEITSTELPYILGMVSFGTNNVSFNGKEFMPLGNASMCSHVGQNIGIKPGTNSIWLYFKTRAAITNCADDSLTLTIQQE